MDKYQAIINSPIGKLGICVTANALAGIDFLEDSVAIMNPQTAIAHLVVNELQAYFKSAQHRFTLPLVLQVSPYQEKVLKALQKIPLGSTQTYGHLAKNLNSAPRAIGMACRHNPIPVVIPCHRIVAAGHLGGYSGATQGAKIKIKEWLLQHEGA